MIMSIPRFYYALCAISAILAIMGAAFMMAMRKVGFHLYVASQILLACLPLFVASQSMNYGGIIISICFIAMYAVYYKKMR